MNSLYRDSLSTKILNVVTRWQVLSMPDLHRLIQDQPNKDSITRITNSLVTKGFLKSISNPTVNAKIITVTDKLMKEYGEKNPDNANTFLVHNTILNSLCLDIQSYENVDEILIEKEINGGERESGELSPDAEAIVFYNNKHERMAIEFELTQKSRTRLVDKFLKFSNSASYSKVIFLFKDERLARLYSNILFDIHNSGNSIQKKILVEKFIFATRKLTTTGESFSGNFNIVFPEDIICLDSYFGTLKLNQ